MTGHSAAAGTSRIWSLSWIIIVRLILYLVIIGFFVQYLYFGGLLQIYRPGWVIIELCLALLVSIGILACGARSEHTDRFVAVTYVLDLVVMTRVVLVSGGFNSVFIPYYLPILVMATAWLPRHYTAVFPSIATLGAAYIGVAHTLIALEEVEYLPFRLYPASILAVLRYAHPHTIVANMLILTVLFFVVSYLSGMLSDRLFIEQRLNNEVLTTMQEGVAVVSPRGKLIFVNNEFRRLYPKAAAAANESRLSEVLFGPETEGLSIARLMAADMSDSMIVTQEAGPEGRPPVEMRISGITLRGQKGLYGLLILVLDLSMRKRMEEAEKGLERFSAISTMAAGLAHEIRNPLASLRSAIQEIGDAFPEGDQNRILTDIIISESDRLDGVVSRFLDFSREGRLRLAKTRLSVILSEIMTMFMHDPQARQVELVMDIQDDPLVTCDADRLKEVFLNLALNAIQAVPAKGGRLDIIVAASDSGFIDGVEVLFIDNGSGIGEEDLPKVFEPFFSTKSSGTGMGLPLSRKQVTMHGGRMEAVRRPEGGTCFRVWLPRQPGDGLKAASRISMPEWRRYISERQL